jgi:hypothetical protein
MPPSLTLKSFAEILELPLYEYTRILREQKYPNTEPAVFRVPFSGIRRFYKSGNKNQELLAAIAKVHASPSIEARKINNVRVLQAFQKSPEAKRQLSPVTASHLRWTYTGIELKNTPELMALEQQREKYISYNFRQQPLPDDIA